VSRVAPVLLAALLLAGCGRSTSGEKAPQPTAPTAKVRLDLSRTEGRSAPFLADFKTSDLYVATAADRIRAINHPIYESPREAEPLLTESSRVLGLVLGGEARAYPVDLLSLHEVVNDVVAGVPVAVTWCPLCFTGIAFDRRVGGRTLTFGVSGYLYHGNQVLFDRQTGSLWSQLLGGAVTGRYRGTELQAPPLANESWGAWLAEHPKTRVLSIRRDALAGRFLRPHTYVTSRGIESTDQPYETYFEKVGTYFPRTVRGIVDGSLVLGVAVGRRAKAYALLGLRRTRVFDDMLAGEPLVVVFDDANGNFTAAAFSRRLGSRTLTFVRRRGDLVDRETGSRWSPTGGRAEQGPLAGAALARLPSTLSFWFAWRAVYPKSAAVP
jgi:Protein of unknown function (DUF3179)